MYKFLDFYIEFYIEIGSIFLQKLQILKRTLEKSTGLWSKTGSKWDADWRKISWNVKTTLASRAKIVETKDINNAELWDRAKGELTQNMDQLKAL